ncbi:MAG: 3-carboxy-cis,cis-muconate cycloisomerase [Armatimonadota bacterium]|nr:3-carboxy-cis,cis-muconate cycloisomerase [Armatimonadota bacterium]MDR7499034.1 3-carboxy-cis,cis-muconate cycloisomerase [Armatimonadota bacterium]MDR7557371.1 3-carboxy-cis,cis-muconate cycloisomerase [Armatimonadota bacterium]MDR7572858.1 3-carboxy-cis,cis-muconate cycloisomerase [Armatimonadota bacterium]
MREAIFATPEMAAVFSDEAFVQRLLDVEAALARAQARAGMIPPSAAEVIGRRCRADLFDLPALFREAAEAGTPVIPLVRRLTELVDAGARGYVHWGATTQDIVDTAVMLQMREGLDLLTARLLALAAVGASLAERHRRTPMAGRTMLQHAVPITFGLKAARWLALTVRLVRRLRRARGEALAVQLGGAAGTLAAMGPSGLRVLEGLAAELGLAVPELPWHAERDRVIEVASLLGMTAAAMGKIAGDLMLLGQTEVGEVSAGAESAGGRSSTMPQKRNPVEAITASAAARLAVAAVPAVLAGAVQEHERAAGGWQAEWEAVPRLFRLTASAVAWTHRALSHLEVHPERMRDNLQAAGGMIMAEALTMALAEKIGREEAYRLVQQLADRAAAAGTGLRQAAEADDRIRGILPPPALARALEVSNYLGSAETFIDRALAAYREIQETGPGQRS